MKVTNSKKAKKQTELEKLLEQHKGEFQQLQNGKIKCLLTSHQFMPSEQNLLAHLNSKSYKKASQSKYDITEYEEILQTHKQGENFLYCRLTRAKVPKKKSAIQKHVNGKRFKSRFEQYKAQLQEEEEQLIDQEGEDNEENEEEEEEEAQEDEIEEEAKVQVPAKKNNSHNNKSKQPTKVEGKKQVHPKKPKNGASKQQKQHKKKKIRKQRK